MNISSPFLLASLLLANMTASASAAPAPAAGLKFEATISMALAEEAAREAVANCASKGYQVAATVVDKAGDIKALFRADGAGPHTADASRRKAYTAASAKNSTSAMLATSQSNPTAQNLGQIDGFLLLGGGLPLRAGSIVIGAIGVGGAPGGPLDEECAQAGIDKIKDRIGN